MGWAAPHPAPGISAHPRTLAAVVSRLRSEAHACTRTANTPTSPQMMIADEGMLLSSAKARSACDASPSVWHTHRDRRRTSLRAHLQIAGLPQLQGDACSDRRRLVLRGEDGAPGRHGARARGMVRVATRSQPCPKHDLSHVARACRRCRSTGGQTRPSSRARLAQTQTASPSEVEASASTQDRLLSMDGRCAHTRSWVLPTPRYASRGEARCGGRGHNTQTPSRRRPAPVRATRALGRPMSVRGSDPIRAV